jgi:acyl-coenzyme A synthetase/AMP-(fatty) acid ligase
MRRDPQAIAQLIAHHQVQKAVFPVVFLQQLTEAYTEYPQVLASLRDVIATGEQLQVTKPMRRVLEQFPACVLHNHYGPSETHVVTGMTLSQPAREWPTHVPIGRPISNTRIYILDGHLDPVPVSFIGQVYVGGTPVGRGYLHQPGLSATRFMADPFAPSPGARMYRTGDLARYQPDGTIVFLGRTDHQVKIRGFRVELAEVEAALLDHPRIREVAVVANAPNSRERQLTAHCVPEGLQEPTVGELRSWLSQRLPDYMLPASFVFLTALPMTPSRKVDRLALQALSGPSVRPAGEFVAARDEVEKWIAEIWSRVLGREPIGIHDNFFELGGHSLAATRVAASMRTVLGDSLPVRAIFDSPTVAQLSQYVAHTHTPLS